MNRGIFAAAGGMRSNQMMLDVLANNLANSSTVGFKRDGVAFTDMLERQMSLPGNPVARQVGRLGSGATVGDRFTFADLGAPVATDGSLDVSIPVQNQFFAVATPRGVRYTRDGSFALNAAGNLVTRDGFEVLDNAGRPVSIGSGGAGASAKIEADGSVMLDGQAIANIGVYTGRLEKAGSNLWTGAATLVDVPQLSPGTLETSNVNVIETMVQIIQLTRNFDSAQRAIQTQDEMTGRLLQSLTTR